MRKVALALTLGRWRELILSLRDKVAAQCCCVEQLTVGFAVSLHASSLVACGLDREEPTPNCSAAS